MNLKEYRHKLRDLKNQMEQVKLITTPVIEQTIQRLKELREYHARYVIVPRLNELQSEYEQTKRLLAMEKRRLAAKKVQLPPHLAAWFAEYSKTHKGRRIRWTNGEWILVSYRDWHTWTTFHQAVSVQGGVFNLGTGRLTKQRIETFAKSAEKQEIRPYVKVG